MEQKLIETRGLDQVLIDFAKARDWEQFHSPKNLAMALSAEVGELVEIFQWLTEEQSKAVMADKAREVHVKDELADVMMYLARLASILGVDLDDAVRAKIVKNSIKYPPCNEGPG
ncbi:MAG: nucleotide pyrophosphohydrolase [Pseudomonadota bacterium]